MKDPIKVDDRVCCGGQPTEDDLAKLHADGIRTVINLRRPGEQGQPLDPVAEGDVATRLGLAYVHIPVDPKNLDPAHVDAVAAAIAKSSGPVYVHCAAGGRATTHALLAQAREIGHSAEHVLAKASSIGAPVTDDGFKAFIRAVAGDGRK